MPAEPRYWTSCCRRCIRSGSRTATCGVRLTGRITNYEYGKPIVIGSNCWFGGNVTVVGGVTIGEGCVIGAGSARPRHQILGQDLTANRYRGRPVQSSPV